MASALKKEALKSYSLSDLKHEAEKLNLKTPPHPTKKQLINLLSNEAKPVRKSNEKKNPYEKSQSNTPKIENQTLNDYHKTHNARRAMPYQPKVIDLSQDDYSEVEITPEIDVKREHSPLLPVYEYKNNNVLNQKIIENKKMDLFERKKAYQNNIFYILLFILLVLVLLNPFFFIIAVICIIGMSFSDPIAQGMIMVESFLHFCKIL